MKLFSLFKDLFKSKRPSRLPPEEAYAVSITNTHIRVEHPLQPPQEIAWAGINEIRLINTDKGPWLPDIWLALVGDKITCMIPHGSSGFDAVFEIVSKYKGFHFENFGKSMTSSNNEEFLLWKRT